MDFTTLLNHHIPDHAYRTLFWAGPIRFSLTKHLIVLWTVSAFLLALLSYAARSRSRAGTLLRMGVEAAALSVRDVVVDPILGHGGRQYLHYFLTLFFFILACNLAGLIPGSATVTGNIAVTGALASCTFALILFAGVRANGPLPFLKHFWPVPSGIPAWVLPFVVFMPLIEVAGIVVKCVALTIRLFANMIAGHIVALGFISLIFILGATSQVVGLMVAPVSVGLVVFVYLIELLVALLQAFIFTLLTAVFVGGFMHAAH
ncbi:MAG: F0F1 ATP synthase subunit A [Elusimicrobiota bacterium]